MADLLVCCERSIIGKESDDTEIQVVQLEPKKSYKSEQRLYPYTKEEQYRQNYDDQQGRLLTALEHQTLDLTWEAG